MQNLLERGDSWKEFLVCSTVVYDVVSSIIRQTRIGPRSAVHRIGKAFYQNNTNIPRTVEFFREKYVSEFETMSRHSMITSVDKAFRLIRRDVRVYSCENCSEKKT